MSGLLAILFGLKPALHTVVVDELNTSSALADLKKWIYFIKFTVPTETTLCKIVWIVLHDSSLFVSDVTCPLPLRLL